LASFDLLVHTGEHETFCQSVQEGLASGIPVVAPRSGGPIDLITPSHTGWLYEPGDATDLRDKVRDLVGDGAKRIAMGASARESVATRTWAGVCDRLMEHYRDAVGRRVSEEAA
jgi:phosphatidylinositol alpha 1,6-mannosyltransferase